MCLIELRITPENNKTNKINNLKMIVIKIWFLYRCGLTIMTVIIRIKTNQK